MEMGTPTCTSKNEMEVKIMEKRKFPYISFGASLLAMLGMGLLTIVLIADYIHLSAVAHSGSDMLPLYLMLFNYPFIALPGAIFSCYCGIRAKITWVKVVSFIIFAICLAILFPFVAELLGWGEGHVVFKMVNWFAGLFMG